MKHTFRPLIFIALTVLYSCHQNPGAYEAAPDILYDKSLKPESPEASQELPAADRKIIKEGEISFETSDVAETKEVIATSVAEFKGYLSNDNVYVYNDRREYRVTIRVPADKFDLLLERISQSARKIDSKNVSTMDVTEEFIDIEARVRTKKELEARYRELLKQAVRVQEILEIEKEIGSLRADIESIEGRLKFLNDRVAFSTLTVTFYEKTSSPFGFGPKLVRAIHNGWTNLLWFFVALISLWPFIIIVVAGIAICRRYNCRLRRKNRVKP